MGGASDEDVRAVSAAVKAAVPTIVAAGSSSGVVSVSWFIAYYGYPVIWLITTTDAERDGVAGHGYFRDEILVALGGAGVQADLVDQTAITAESQETVDRDYGGDWYDAMK